MHDTNLDMKGHFQCNLGVFPRSQNPGSFMTLP